MTFQLPGHRINSAGAWAIQQLAIVRLLLPARDSGTVFLLTSSLPRHSQHFVGN